MTADHGLTKTASDLNLRPCRHQVAGHLFEEGKAGSLVDDAGHFYKPLQHGPRGDRELRFYELVKELAEECTPDLSAALRALDPFAPARPVNRRRSSDEHQVVGRSHSESIRPGAPRRRATAEDGLLRGNATVTSRNKMEAWPRSPSKQEAGDAAGSLLGASMPSLPGSGGGQLAHQRSDGMAASSWRTESWRPEKDELTRDLVWRYPSAAAGGKPGPPAIATRVSSSGGGAGRAAGGGSGGGGGSAAAAAGHRPPRPGSMSGGVFGRRSGEQQRGGTSTGSASGASVAGSNAGSVAGSVAGSPFGSPFAHASQQSAENAFSLAPTMAAARSGAAAALEDDHSSPADAAVVAAGQNGRRSLDAAAAKVPLAHTAVPPQQDQQFARQPMPDLQEQQQQQQQCSCAPVVGGLTAELSAAAQGSAPAAVSQARTAADAAVAAGAATDRPSIAAAADATAPGASSVAAGGSSTGSTAAGLDSGGITGQPGASERSDDAAEAALPAGTSFVPSEQRSDVHPTMAAQDHTIIGGNGYMMPYQRQAAFVLRNAPMLRAIPRFYGTVQSDDCLLLELEDVAQSYKRPSIIDIKVGFKTWYPGSDERYIAKCQAKDAATTQSKLGFKICGMQVFRHLQRGFWRASKRWCKGMSEDAVNKALLRFANNEAGLTPKDIYGGPRGAIAQLAGLADWFAHQREFCFYSSSVLIIYEGAASSADAAAVSIRLVDFAHTFPSNGQPDENFTAGARALLQALTAVLSMDAHDCLI